MAEIGKTKLDTGWLAARSTEVDLTGVQLTTTHPPSGSDSPWMEAVVPGTVLATLVKNKLVPDPFYGLENDSIIDIADSGREYYTFWFFTSFRCKLYQSRSLVRKPALLPRQRASTEIALPTKPAVMQIDSKLSLLPGLRRITSDHRVDKPIIQQQQPSPAPLITMTNARKYEATNVAKACGPTSGYHKNLSPSPEASSGAGNPAHRVAKPV